MCTTKFLKPTVQVAVAVAMAGGEESGLRSGIRSNTWRASPTGEHLRQLILGPEVGMGKCHLTDLLLHPPNRSKSYGNELKHPNLCYCSVGQREANCKEFVLRAAETRICCFRNISGDIARKAKEKNKFLPSFQSFRPFNLATYAVCRAKHSAAIGYPLMTKISMEQSAPKRYDVVSMKTWKLAPHATELDPFCSTTRVSNNAASHMVVHNDPSTIRRHKENTSEGLETEGSPCPLRVSFFNAVGHNRASLSANISLPSLA